ncbi:protein-L-isoaspartate O-methyltransferase family protein [Caulobacter hibisci]|uniref:Protein-L-isoaspartate O-methyltransferase n=1 Tax=Caulobacter hibisci TaxID=2035993 RepID=A0ABS0SVC7_9CAUL|nr:protein-L-isoaspartate O-methyltransferase [Caulobacter hibisci]MBI1683236.1 protein-L-isoaspartate O-methyltransferase [Caulobacter hibisci]
MSSDFAAARLNMVESQIRTADVTDLPLQDALRVVPRENLVPAGKGYLAYADAEVEYAPGRALMRPRDIGKLLQIIKPRAGEKALAIAAPYAAVVLETMGLAVTRLDGDDLAAVPGGEYDVIVCEGGVPKAPGAWTAALALHGRLGVVERQGPVGRATLYVRAEDGVGARAVFDSTPSLLAGFPVEAGFAF